MPDPIVDVDRVTKRFAGHMAVAELSLGVPAGTIYGLLGPNGAGKTTTIRMLMDIYEPDEGVVRLFGTAEGGRRHSARVGYLPEERGLYPKMRVLDVLVFLAEAKGIARRQARARALEWLERLGLADWRLRRVSDLSKGMQQKVQFISTVLHDPDLVVLDEPFAGLDPVNSQGAAARRSSSRRTSFGLTNDPNSGLSQALSMIPFTSPIAMPVRFTAGDIGPAEVLLSLGILVAGIGAVTWIAARIYRVGILMTGKRPNFRELIRWVRTA